MYEDFLQMNISRNMITLVTGTIYHNYDLRKYNLNGQQIMKHALIGTQLGYLHFLSCKNDKINLKLNRKTLELKVYE
jgi:hypothetical protein